MLSIQCVKPIEQFLTNPVQYRVDDAVRALILQPLAKRACCIRTAGLCTQHAAANVAESIGETVKRRAADDGSVIESMPSATLSMPLKKPSMPVSTFSALSMYAMNACTASKFMLTLGSE